MKGADLQAAIIQLAHAQGWRVLHVKSVLVSGKGGRSYYAAPYNADAKGWPDIFLVRRDRIVAIEVKGKGDRLSEEQRQWLADLDAVPSVDAIVATPADWSSHDSKVVALLR